MLSYLANITQPVSGRARVQMQSGSRALTYTAPVIGMYEALFYCQSGYLTFSLPCVLHGGKPDT